MTDFADLFDSLYHLVFEPYFNDYRPSKESFAQVTMTISTDYLITPITTSIMVFTLVSFYILSPVLSKKFFQQYNSFTEDKKIYWNTLPGSTIHSIVLCTVVVTTFLYGSILSDDVVQSKSKLGFLALQISAGYFVGDFIAILSHKYLRSDTKIVLHHITSFTAVFLGLAFQGRWLILILLHLFSELSTPFVNLRWVLSETKTPKNSWIFIFDAFGVTITFFISRIFALPVLVYTMYLCMIRELDPSLDYHVPFSIKAFAVVLTFILHCLNLFWAYKIARGCIKFVKALKHKD